MIEITILVVIVAIFTGILFLCDDRKKVIQFLKKEKKQIILILIPLVIYLGYVIYLRTAVWVSNDSLWNPYIFSGMPSYAIAIGGYKWWNLIYVFVDVTKTVLFYCPAGAIFFAGSIIWFSYKKTMLAYLLMIFIEIAMLYIAYWGMGIDKGWLI